MSDSVGRGVFSTRRFAQFDVILVEPPLLVSFHERVRGDEAEVATRMAEKLRKQASRLRSSHLEELAMLLGAPDVSVIMMKNSMALGFEPVAGGLFVACAHFNHSCTPNSRYAWNEATGKEEVRALRDILPGEEVTVAYRNVLKPTRERLDDILRSHGFVCTCRACTSADRLDDAWRERLRVLDAEIYLTVSRANYVQGVRLAEERLELLKKETWAVFETSRTCFDAFQACRNAGWTGKAQLWAKRCLQADTALFGPGHPETRAKRDLLREFLV